MMEDNDWLKGLQSKMKDYEEPAPEGIVGRTSSLLSFLRKSVV